jgi:hypothetical protein
VPQIRTSIDDFKNLYNFKNTVLGKNMNLVFVWWG